MYGPDQTGRANARQTAMTPALLAGSTDSIGTVGNRPLRNGSAAERIARMQNAMQRAKVVLASNPPKEMTRQEINEEISAYRKLKRLATAS